MPSSATHSLFGPREAAARFLTFTLGPTLYGVRVLQVREIMRLVPITFVAQMPAYVRGVINLRGVVVPVADLRVRLGLPETNRLEDGCIVVARIEGRDGRSRGLGLVVDTVEEVAQVAQDDVVEPPEFGAAISTDHILGMARIRDRVTTLLDLDHLFALE